MPRKPVLLLAFLPLMGCAQALEQYQAVTSGSAGAAALIATTPDEAFRESLAKCATYRRSLSVTQRSGGTTLALLAATAGALGLAFVPAGTATIAGFTAASTILASASAQTSDTIYLGLSSEEIARRFSHYYDEPMRQLRPLLAAGTDGVNQVHLIHFNCSLGILISNGPVPAT